jgi:hypothetical protein
MIVFQRSCFISRTRKRSFMAPAEKVTDLSQSYSMTQTKLESPSNTNPILTCTITTSFQQIYCVHIHNNNNNIIMTNMCIRQNTCIKLDKKQIVEVDERLQSLPSDIMQNEITMPKTPNKNIVEKFLKNCFFLT